MTTATPVKPQPKKIVQPIGAIVEYASDVKERKDGGFYISYKFRCSDSVDRWKSIDADEGFLPVGTNLMLVPYWDDKGKEHHQLVPVGEV